MFKFRELVGVFAGALLLSATPQFAAAQSNQPLSIVLPYDGGGMVDTVVRMIAEKMSAELSRPVIVENKPGANGIIGAQYVASAAPDGNTILAGLTAPVSLNPLLRPDLPYQISSFEPVAMLFDGPLGVTVSSSLGVNSIDELAAYAKSSGKPIRYATLGPGGVSHLFGLMLGKRLGVEMVPVAYQNNPASFVDLLGGQVELNFATPIAVAEHVKSGAAKMLAITTEERDDSYPDVPTMVELGYPELVASFWTGLLAPAGTPQETVDRIGAAAVKAMESEEISGFISTRGLDPKPGGPQAMADQLARDESTWGEIIKSENLTLR